MRRDLPTLVVMPCRVMRRMGVVTSSTLSRANVVKYSLEKVGRLQPKP